MFNPIKKIQSIINYTTTIFFSIIHILFLVLLLKIRENNIANELVLTVTLSKILIVINIVYLLIFLFVGHPKFYLSNAKKSVKNVISFLKTLISIANASLFLKVASITIHKIDDLEGLNVFAKWFRLNKELSTVGLNGFVVFFMYISLISSVIRVIIWVIRFLKFILKKRT